MIKIFGFRQIEPNLSCWEINDKLHSKLSLEVIKKIHSEAELRFNSTVDDLTLLRSRAYGLITIFISLLSILITLYFGEYLELQLDNKKELAFLYVVNVIMIAYVIVQLVIIVFPNKVMLKGEEPKIMNYEGMASLDFEEQNEIYLYNSIQVVQEKIEYNEAIISNKNQRLESVIFIATFIFIFTLVFELIIKSF